VRRAIPLALLAALMASVPLAVSAYREGPLPAMTGGFGEKTCHTCHFDNRLNDRLGSVRLEGVLPAYVPGREYTLTVIVHRAGIKRAGFELAVRFADGADKSHQAGTLRPADGRTQMAAAPGSSIQYIQHNKPGSDLAGPDEGRWTVLWAAPSPPAGRVIFTLAGNAANGDASALGDFIYTTSLTSHAGPR